jgi:hypothetical protein
MTKVYPFFQLVPVVSENFDRLVLLENKELHNSVIVGGSPIITAPIRPGIDINFNNLCYIKPLSDLELRKEKAYLRNTVVVERLIFSVRDVETGAEELLFVNGDEITNRAESAATKDAADMIARIHTRGGLTKIKPFLEAYIKIEFNMLTSRVKMTSEIWGGRIDDSKEVKFLGANISLLSMSV